MRNKIIISDKSSDQLEVIIIAKECFFMKNKIIHSDMFENDYIMRWSFCKRGNSILQFEKTKFLMVYNFKCRERSWCYKLILKYFSIVFASDGYIL